MLTVSGIQQLYVSRTFFSFLGFVQSVSNGKYKYMKLMVPYQIILKQENPEFSVLGQ